MALLRFALVIMVSVILSEGVTPGQEFPALPEDISFVNDMAGILSIDEHDVLDIRLMEYYDSTGIILMVVTIEGFNGIKPENYTAGLVVKWGIGAVFGEKALLMVVKPRNANGPAFADIKPNNIMAGEVRRDILNHIAEKEILPLIKKGKYYPAVFTGVESLKRALAGNYRPAGKSRLPFAGNISTLTILLLAALIILTARLFRKPSD